MTFELSDEEVEILMEALKYLQETTFPDDQWSNKQNKKGKPYIEIAEHLFERLNLDLTD